EVDRRELERTELTEVAADADAEALVQILPGNGAGGDAHDGLARRGTPAAAVIAEAVLLLVREIGVSRPEAVLDLVVVAAALVHVLDQQPDGRARRDALEDARKNPDLVRLLALRDVAGAARPAPVEILLDVRPGQREAPRAAADPAAERGAVARAERGDRAKPPHY